MQKTCSHGAQGGCPEQKPEMIARYLSAGRNARQTSRSYSKDDQSLLLGALSEQFPLSGRQVGPNLANIGPLRTEVGRHRPDSGQIWPNSASMDIDANLLPCSSRFGVISHFLLAAWRPVRRRVIGRAVLCATPAARRRNVFQHTLNMLQRVGSRGVRVLSSERACSIVFRTPPPHALWQRSPQ